MAVLSMLALAVLGVGAGTATAAPTTTNTFAVTGTSTPAGGSPSTFGPGTLQATVTATGFTDGALTLPSTTYTGYRLLGFIPASVTAHVAATAPVTGAVEAGTLTVTSSVDLVIDQVLVAGFPALPAGGSCRTSTPSTVTLTGAASTLQSGGTLTGGTYTAAPFTGCGVFGPVLEPLLDATVSGTPTVVTTTLGTPTKAAQSITFTSTAPTTAVAGGTYAPTATATSGLPVTLGATGDCAIAGSVVTFTAPTATAPGRCTITADQAGNANYDPAPSQSQSTTVVAAARALDESFGPTSDPTYCGVIVSGTGFAPNTVFTTTSSVTRAGRVIQTVVKQVTSDAAGAIKGQLFSYFQYEGDAVSTTIDGTTSPTRTITC